MSNRFSVGSPDLVQPTVKDIRSGHVRRDRHRIALQDTRFQAVSGSAADRGSDGRHSDGQIVVRNVCPCRDLRHFGNDLYDVPLLIVRTYHYAVIVVRALFANRNAVNISGFFAVGVIGYTRQIIRRHDAAFYLVQRVQIHIVGIVVQRIDVESIVVIRRQSLPFPACRIAVIGVHFPAEQAEACRTAALQPT